MKVWVSGSIVNSSIVRIYRRKPIYNTDLDEYVSSEQVNGILSVCKFDLAKVFKVRASALPKARNECLQVEINGRFVAWLNKGKRMPYKSRKKDT